MFRGPQAIVQVRRPDAAETEVAISSKVMARIAKVQV